MSRFEKWSVWITSALTVATGVGYFVTKYLFTPVDAFAAVSHPWQPFFLKAHILVSPLLLFALGTITVRHVWQHFVSGVRWSRRTATVTAVSVVPMVVTGYLIQVLTDQGWVRAMAIAHIVFGFVYALGLAAHTWIVRRGPDEGTREEAGKGRVDEVAGRTLRSRSPTGGPPGREVPVDSAPPEPTDGRPLAPRETAGRRPGG